MSNPFFFRRFAWLICWLTVLVLPAVQADVVVVEHAQGTTTLPHTPQRVAVLDLATLDTLLALEVDVAGIPQASWPGYLQSYDESGATRIGTLFEPDFEALTALAPDLIIVAGRSRSSYEQLSAIAPTIDLTIDPASFVADIRRNLELLGQIFEQPEQAKTLDAKLTGALDTLQASGAQAGSALTLFTVNGNVMIHAPGDRFGMIHELTGMASVATPAEAQPRSERPPAGSPEAEALRQQQRDRLAQALNQEPDWLFILDRGAATGGGESTAAETLAQHDLIAASTTWQQEQVYYLDPPTWYIATGGYLGLLHTIEELQKALGER